MKNQRVPTEYIVTRKQARHIAKKRMREDGKRNINRHSYSTYSSETGKTYTTYNSSYFADNWRDYITWPQKVQSQKV